MIPAVRIMIVLLAVGGVGACDTGTTDQLQNQIMLMQERLVELESQVADSQEHAERLGTAVGQLQAYVGEVEKEVIDLSAHVPRDLLVNVEANVGNVKTKLAEVSSRSEALQNSLGSGPSEVVQ